MATKTLRPLKKGDPCYVRIQRRGKPVLAVYDYKGHDYHAVFVGGKSFLALCGWHARIRGSSDNYLRHECLFFAKPVTSNQQEQPQ